MVRIAAAVAILLAAAALLNLVYQMIRKPTELFVFVGNALDKDPSETWRQYGPLFRKLSTATITPELLAALAQGVLAGPAALYLFAVSVQRLGVARAAVFPACVPALTLLVGWLLLGERPTALQAAGLVTVLCGFYLAQRQR